MRGPPLCRAATPATPATTIAVDLDCTPANAVLQFLSRGGLGAVLLPVLALDSLNQQLVAALEELNGSPVQVVTVFLEKFFLHIPRNVVMHALAQNETP